MKVAPRPGRTVSEHAPSAGHLAALTDLRGVASLVVVAYHFGAPVIDGHLGVEVFFVLSGFVLARSELRRAAGSPFGLAPFLRRRVVRIAPPLVVFVAVRLAFLVALDTPVRTIEFISALTFTSNILYIHSAPPWAMVITWTLAVEMQFAVVFALLFRVTASARRLAGTAAGLIVASTAWRLLLSGLGVSSTRLRYGLDTRLDQLLFGVLIAALLHQAAPALVPWRAALAHRATPIIATAAVIASVALETRFGHAYRNRLGMTVDMVAIGAIVAHVAIRPTALAVPTGIWSRFNPLRWIGARSYSLYLYHALVYRMTLRWWRDRGALQLVVAFALSIVAAEASHRFVDERFPARPRAR